MSLVRAHLSKLISIVLYFMGLLCLFLCDVVIGKWLPVHDVTNWAVIRSIIGIMATIALTGFDQIFIREKELSPSIFALLLVQVPIISVISAVTLNIIGIFGNFYLSFATSVTSSLSVALSNYSRSFRRDIMAQIFHQSWKIMMLAMIVVGTIYLHKLTLLTSLSICMFIFGLMYTALCLRCSLGGFSREGLRAVTERYPVGIRIMLTAIILSLSIYAEQLVISSFGTTHDSFKYFVHSTYFLFPSSIVGGYLAFFIGPFIRDNRDSIFDTMKQWRLRLLLALLFFAAFLYGSGVVAWRIVAPAKLDMDSYVILMFMTVSMLRVIYTLPAHYIAVCGQPRDHDIINIMHLMILIFAASIIYILNNVEGMSIIYATATASLCNWLLRTVAGYAVMSSINTKHRSRYKLAFHGS